MVLTLSSFIHRNTISGTDQTIEPVATLGRIDKAARTNDGHCLAGIVQAGIKVRYVVGLRDKSAGSDRVARQTQS